MIKRLIILFLLIMSATTTTIEPKIQGIDENSPISNFDLPYIN